MTIRIHLTGKLGIERDWEPVLNERQIRGKQGRLAFAYLVCERTRVVSREELAGVIWPGEEMATAWEAALSALISRLRRLLAPLSDAGVWLSSGLGLYRLNLATDVWIDLEAGMSALDGAESAIRAGLPKQGFGSAVVALNIAKRPFLPMNDGEWVETQRRKLERQRLRALECLAQIWLASGEPLLAVESATEAVTLDPFRESSYQLLMRAHAAVGNRPKAVHMYRRLKDILAKELETTPTAETDMLLQEMLGQA